MRSLTQVAGLVLLVFGAVALVGTLGGIPEVTGAAFRWIVPLGVIGVGLWIMAAAGREGRPRGAAAAQPTDGWAVGKVWPQSPLPPDVPRAASGAGTSASIAPAANDLQSGSWPAAARDPGDRWGPAGLGIERVIGEIELAGPLTLRPARFQTLIGEVRLDLSAASLPEGETPVSVSTVVGEIRVLLPSDAGAIVRGRTRLGEVELLGQVEGPLLPYLTASTEGYATSPRRIRLDVQSGIGRVGVRRARGGGTIDAGRPAATPDGAAPPAVAGSHDTGPVQG